jgi:hypothetical protein
VTLGEDVGVTVEPNAPTTGRTVNRTTKQASNNRVSNMADEKPKQITVKWVNVRVGTAGTPRWKQSAAQWRVNQYIS